MSHSKVDFMQAINASLHMSVNRSTGPQILITSASEERLEDEDEDKQFIIRIFDWIFVLMTICLIWVSALTRTCWEWALLIGTVSSAVVLTLFVVIYKSSEWRFDANKDIEQSQVIFDFDRILSKKRNSVNSIAPIDG